MILDGTLDRRLVVLVGAGGHARVCIDALRDCSNTTIVGVVSRDRQTVANLGVEIIGTDDELAAVMRAVEATHAFVAIGDNALRGTLVRLCHAESIPLVTAISRAATLSPSAAIGAGSLLCAGAIVNAGASLDDGVILNTNASIDHDCVVGFAVHLAPASTLAGGVVIEEQVLVGMGARVLPGIRIGARAIVGAGAVVTRDVPPDTTVVGIPARIVQTNLPTSRAGHS